MAITFERGSLYERVWTTPMTKLAAEFQLSDNGLRKVCTSLNVPWPGRGYWAKLAAGKPVRKTPLPAVAVLQTKVSNPPPATPPNPYHLPEDDDWLEARLLFEQDPANAINFEREPKTWHPALIEIRDLAKEKVKSISQWKDHHERREARKAKHPNLKQPWSMDDHRWQSHVDHGSAITPTHHHRASPIRASETTILRALAVVNSIFRAAAKRGIVADLDNQEGRFRLSLDGASIHFAVREALADDWRDDYNSSSGKVQKVKYKKATGRLFIAVYRTWEGRNYRDDPEGNFGDLNLMLFDPLFRKVVAAREAARKRVEDQRRIEEGRVRMKAIEEERAAQELARKEAERLLAIEKTREESLLSEAETWRRSAALRSYLQHLSSADSQCLGTEWMRWATQVADRLDPTQRRLSDVRQSE